MNRKTDQDRLLTDVLDESDTTGFHEALLGETLRRAQHRRRLRAVRRVTATLAALVIITVIAIRQIPRTPLVEPTRAPSYELTSSQPLPAASMVTTQPLTADQLVVSTRLVGTIQTVTAHPLYHEVGDDELLALAPEPAALIRRGHQAELVFVSPPTATPTSQN